LPDNLIISSIATYLDEEINASEEEDSWAYRISVAKSRSGNIIENNNSEIIIGQVFTDSGDEGFPTSTDNIHLRSDGDAIRAREKFQKMT
jgi:hypothetical protein